MFDIKAIFKTLGIPLGLVGVVVALLAWVGISAEQLGVVAASLVGLQLMGSFLIDMLKYVGVVKDGASGQWSAAFQLIVLVGVAVWLEFFPSFDGRALDAQLLELAKLFGLIFVYVTQIVGAKAIHRVAVDRGIAYSFDK